MRQGYVAHASLIPMAVFLPHLASAGLQAHTDTFGLCDVFLVSAESGFDF